MSRELQDKMLYGSVSVLLAIVGFIGMRLWAQVDGHTIAISSQAVVDAAMLEQLKTINSTLEDMKQELKRMSQHEQVHRGR